MQLNGGKQALQHRLPQPGCIQNHQTGIRGGCIVQRSAHLPVSTAQGSVGAKQLRAAVCRVRVGVHNAARQLAQLADMPHQQHLFKVRRSCHIQRISDKVGRFDHRDISKLRIRFMQIVQPVIARGKDEPPVVVCPQRRLIHLQLDGVQNGLLAHGFYNAAGAQHRQSALYPDMGVEGAPGHLLAAGDRDSHGKAAGITGGFRLPAQRLGDHLPGHMVDGGLPHRLVQPGLRHPAHSRAAGNTYLGCAGQTGGHVHIVAAVLFNGAFRTLGNGAAEQGSHLHHDAFRRAQSDSFRCSAGQQQTSGPGSGQRRTGAGGVAAAQQLLPAAHIVLKLRLFRLWWAKNSAVLFLGQAVERFDIFPGKGLCRWQGGRDAMRRNTYHRVRDLLRHVQLVQGHDDRKLLLMR